METLTVSQNPYPGIRSFEAEEAHLFFGRDSQIRECIHKLSRCRFLAIVGSSGCGKSSLIKAGIVPTLLGGKSAEFSRPWTAVLFRPGTAPIGNMAAAITRSLGQNAHHDPLSIEGMLRKSADGLTAVYRAMPACREKNLCIVLDQFEELFRYRQQAAREAQEDAVHFVKLFLSAVGQQKVPIYIAFSMRSDFIDSCTEFSGLPEALNEGSYLVPRMTGEEKVEAIRLPAQRCGGTVADDCVARLLEDMGNDPDQLPVLQHALMRTWDYWLSSGDTGGEIALRHYEAIGTMKNALSLHGEEIFSELPGDKDKLITEKIFKSLTDIVQQGRCVRRPTRLSEICRIVEGHEEDVGRVIDRFRQHGRAFLLPHGGVPLAADTIIDIAHESIMRIWGRLREWVDEETKSVNLYLRLARSAELYQKGEAGLWVNPELQLGLNWLEQNRPNLAWAQRYDPSFDRAVSFLEHSRKAYQHEIEKRDLIQRRRLSRAKRFAFLMGGISIVSILVLIVSLHLKFQADQSRRRAIEKEKLARIASRNAEVQRKEALIQKRIAEQQQQIADQQRLITEEQRQYALIQQQIAEEQRQQAVIQRKMADIARVEAVEAKEEAVVQRQEALTQKQIAEEQRVIAEKSEENTRRLRLLAVARSIAIQSQKVQSGNVELAALLALQAYVFNVENGGSPQDPDIFYALSGVIHDVKVFRGHGDAVRALAVASDGRQLYSSSDDGTVRVWQIHDANQAPIELHTGQKTGSDLRCLTVSANGEILVAGGYQGQLIIWENPHSRKKAEELYTAMVAVTALEMAIPEEIG